MRGDDLDIDDDETLDGAELTDPDDPGSETDTALRGRRRPSSRLARRDPLVAPRRGRRRRSPPDPARTAPASPRSVVAHDRMDPHDGIEMRILSRDGIDRAATELQ